MITNAIETTPNTTAIKCSTRQVAYLLATLLPAPLLQAVERAIYNTEHDSRISDQQVKVAESILDQIESLR